MYNIPIYFCNIDTRQLQHNYETFETLDTDACNMRFQHKISLVLGRMEARRRVEFTGIELAGGAEIAAPVEKAATGPVEKAVVGLHTVRVEREL